MLMLRKSEERGKSDLGWLKSRFTFSFAEYHDPNHHHFRNLRVINEDWVSPDAGFGMHPHRDMEIITYVISGAVEHEDSMGNRFIIKAGDLQAMSAGTGVTHSEKNPSSTETLHLLQIWIFPDRKNLAPCYGQKHFSKEDKRGKMRIIASPDGRQGSLTIHQDVKLYASILGKGEKSIFVPDEGRHVWLQVISGRLKVQDQLLHSGDGLCASAEKSLSLECLEETEFLLFDLG